MFKLSLQPGCILALYKRSGDCLNLYAILGDTDLEWLLILSQCLYVFTKVQIIVGQQPAIRIWTVHCLFSTSLFMLYVDRTARLFACRPTVHIGLFFLSAFQSIDVTGPVTEYNKTTRGNVTQFSHIASRQKLFFS